MPQHNLLTGADLHEPKGVETATAGQVYVADGAGSGDWSTPVVPDTGWTMLYKSADTTRSSTTTISADPILVFPVAANKHYLIRGAIFLLAQNGVGLKYQWTGPSSVTGFRSWESYYGSGAAGNASTMVIVSLPSSTTGLADAPATDGLMILKYDIALRTNANTGNFALSWAQTTSSATASGVLAGSYMEYLDVTP